MMVVLWQSKIAITPSMRVAFHTDATPVLGIRLCPSAQHATCRKVSLSVTFRKGFRQCFSGLMPSLKVSVSWLKIDMHWLPRQCRGCSRNTERGSLDISHWGMSCRLHSGTNMSRSMRRCGPTRTELGIGIHCQQTLDEFVGRCRCSVWLVRQVDVWNCSSSMREIKIDWAPLWFVISLTDVPFTPTVGAPTKQ